MDQNPRGARKKRPVSTDTFGTEIKLTPIWDSCARMLFRIFEHGVLSLLEQSVHCFAQVS
jgi:hypothetical protein